VTTSLTGIEPVALAGGLAVADIAAGRAGRARAGRRLGGCRRLLFNGPRALAGRAHWQPGYWLMPPGPSEPGAESRGNRPTARSSLRRARELTATGRNEHRTLPAASLLMDPLKKLGAWGHHVAATFCFAVPLEVRQGAAGTASDQATGRPCGPMQQSCAQRARPSDGDRACVTSAPRPDARARLPRSQVCKGSCGASCLCACSRSQREEEQRRQTGRAEEHQIEPAVTAEGG
jgi:hypothetical protein